MSPTSANKKANRADAIDFRTIVESSGYPIFVWSGEQIIFANGAAANWLGYECIEQIVGLDAHTLLTDKAVPEELWDPNSRDSIEFEMVFRRAGGEVRFAIVNRLPLEVDGGTTFALIARDTTSAKRTQETLLRLASFPHQEPDPVIELNFSGDVVFSNPAANADFPDLLALGVAHPIFRDFAEVVADMQEDGADLKRQTICVDDRHYDQSFFRVPGHELVRVFLHDITPAIAAQTKLNESLEALRATQEKLLAASRIAGMADIATSVLHNIGNTLSGLRVALDAANAALSGLDVSPLSFLGQAFRLEDQALINFAVDPNRGRKVPEFLGELTTLAHHQKDHALRELGEASTFVEHISAIVAMQQLHAKGRFAAIDERVRAQDLLQSAIRLSHHEIAQANFEIAIDCPEDLSFCVDRHKCQQILVNLLRNARESILAAAPSLPQLTIEARKRSETQLEIAVLDNGVGIDPGDLVRIFGNGYTTKADGHGFGLHSSACAAMELGGNLSAQSEGKGHGARFVLTLPLEAAHSAAA
jgi:PAS domain S-box-containing protein